MLFTVRPCSLCLPQPLIWPRQPGSGHGSHVGSGGSGQGSSRQSGGGGTGVNTAGAGGGAGGGSGGAPASAGGGGGSAASAAGGSGGSSAAASAGGGGGSAAAAAAAAGGGGGSSAAVSAGGGGGSAAAAAATADCSQKFVIVSKVFTSDKEAFLCIRLRMTPQYSIDRSQRTVHNSWVTMHCEVNGRSLTCVLYTCCMHIFYSFLMLVQYNMPSHTFGW